MANVQKAQLPVPRTAIKALLYLEKYKAEIVLHDDKCYLLSDDKALYLTDKIFDALTSAGWITPLEAIDNEHSRCVITPAGREKVKSLREAASGYVQDYLFEEEHSFADVVGSAPTGRAR